MEDESHAENAVKCAIEMVKRMETINGSLGMGIGISAGRVITGIFGSESKKGIPPSGCQLMWLRVYKNWQVQEISLFPI